MDVWLLDRLERRGPTDYDGTPNCPLPVYIETILGLLWAESGRNLGLISRLLAAY